MIQARYGWTDDEVLSRPYARFVQIMEAMSKNMAQEAKSRAIDGAWIAWQTGRFEVPLTFKDYLEKMGLADPPEVMTAESAIGKAEDALNRLKGGEASRELFE
jgi:hypothetical protein